MRISDWSSACALPIFSRLASRAGGYVIAAGSGIADFVLVLVAAIFLASDPATYRRGLLLMLPVRAEATAALALDDTARGLQGWMVGQAVSSLVVAALTWAGLALLCVPAAGGLDRKSVVEGQSVDVRVEPGGRLIIKKKER